MATQLQSETSARFSHLIKSHPCLSGSANTKAGRMHLPVSLECNIRCGFCIRSLNDNEERPGVSTEIISPLDASKYVKQALSLCPEINVIGIAGPGDTLASTHAIETFERIHADFPDKIMCLSTNGLMLEKNVDRLVRAGVQTISVTVNSVDPLILSKIVKYIIWDEQVYTGVKAAEILLGAQLRGIKRASEKGLLVKCNTVLIPNLNDRHIGEIAKTLSGVGASLLNIIPLIPQGDFDNYDTPSCAMLNLARKNAEKYLPVFRHCKHCRADACGIPGKNIEFSGILYGHQAVNTFSHG